MWTPFSKNGKVAEPTETEIWLEDFKARSKAKSEIRAVERREAVEQLRQAVSQLSVEAEAES